MDGKVIWSSQWSNR